MWQNDTRCKALRKTVVYLDTWLKKTASRNKQVLICENFSVLAEIVKSWNKRRSNNVVIKIFTFDLNFTFFFTLFVRLETNFSSSHFTIKSLAKVLREDVGKGKET